MFCSEHFTGKLDFFTSHFHYNLYLKWIISIISYILSLWNLFETKLMANLFILLYDLWYEVSFFKDMVTFMVGVVDWSPPSWPDRVNSLASSFLCNSTQYALKYSAFEQNSVNFVIYLLTEWVTSPQLYSFPDYVFYVC